MKYQIYPKEVDINGITWWGLKINDVDIGLESSAINLVKIELIDILKEELFNEPTECH